MPNVARGSYVLAFRSVRLDLERFEQPLIGNWCTVLDVHQQRFHACADRTGPRPVSCERP